MPERLLVLDTDIVSLTGRQRPPPGLRQWLLEVGIERLAVCFPVIIELMRGAYLLRERDPERAAMIRDWIEKIMATDFIVPAMGPDVAEIYARMTSLPALRHMWTTSRTDKKNRLGHDLLIASVSIVYDAPIITANPKDYVRINDWFPLPGVYQPLEGRWHVPPDHPVKLPPLDPKNRDSTPDQRRSSWSCDEPMAWI
ncbi:type II toxin-antitoxin system VapC family toxin [Agrobacterium tumefaciens]|uniref:type II toxin-antitoxin system VapC family toxin n=1 Tax=Agrobacterium tumefaciens TaxID=358 RepID=UPI003BA3AD74